MLAQQENTPSNYAVCRVSSILLCLVMGIDHQFGDYLHVLHHSFVSPTHLGDNAQGSKIGSRDHDGFT